MNWTPCGVNVKLLVLMPFFGSFHFLAHSWRWNLCRLVLRTFSRGWGGGIKKYKRPRDFGFKTEGPVTDPPGLTPFPDAHC